MLSLFFSLLWKRGFTLCSRNVLLFSTILVSPQLLAFDDTISLPESVQRALQYNPKLQLFTLARLKLEGQRQASSMRPPVELSIELENFAGSDSLKGFDAAEATIAISSVVELGSKRQKRISAMTARERKLAIEQQISSLSLVATVTQRYVTLLSAQHRLQLAQNTASLSKQTLKSVQQRVDAGASPRSELLRAQAALHQSEILIAENESQSVIARALLFEMWGGEDWDSVQADGDLFSLPTPIPETVFAESLRTNPNIEIFASEEKIQLALLELAASEKRSDVQWQIGARQFQENNESALVVGINIPLFSGKRNQGEVTQARASVEEVRQNKAVTLFRLRTQVIIMASEYRQLFMKLETIRDEVIPLLEQALADAQTSYERGRYSYLDLVAARQELLLARKNRIATASRALSIHADIEQLTAEPFFDSVNQGSRP